MHRHRHWHTESTAAGSYSEFMLVHGAASDARLNSLEAGRAFPSTASDNGPGHGPHLTVDSSFSAGLPHWQPARVPLSVTGDAPPGGRGLAAHAGEGGHGPAPKKKKRILNYEYVSYPWSYPVRVPEILPKFHRRGVEKHSTIANRSPWLEYPEIRAFRRTRWHWQHERLLKSHDRSIGGERKFEQ